MSTRTVVTELDCGCCGDIVTEPCCGYEAFPAHWGFQLGNTPHGSDPDVNCNESMCQALNIPIVLDYHTSECFWSTQGKYIGYPPGSICSTTGTSIGFELTCTETHWVLTFNSPGGIVTWIHPVGTWNIFGSNVMTLDQTGNFECDWPTTVTISPV